MDGSRDAVVPCIRAELIPLGNPKSPRYHSDYYIVLPTIPKTRPTLEVFDL